MVQANEIYPPFVALGLILSMNFVSLSTSVFVFSNMIPDEGL